MEDANKKLVNGTYILDLVYNAAVERVWEALTSEEQMRQWYFPQLRNFEPVAGFRFEFANDGSAYQKEWTVTEVAEKQKLSHTWSYTGYPGVSEVSFELFGEGVKTRLRLTHSLRDGGVCSYVA